MGKKYVFSVRFKCSTEKEIFFEMCQTMLRVKNLDWKKKQLRENYAFE
jgi:hypothetical protein